MSSLMYSLTSIFSINLNLPILNNLSSLSTSDVLSFCLLNTTFFHSVAISPMKLNSLHVSITSLRSCIGNKLKIMNQTSVGMVIFLVSATSWTLCDTFFLAVSPGQSLGDLFCDSSPSPKYVCLVKICTEIQGVINTY